MFEKELNSFGRVTVRFVCKKCGNLVEGNFAIPSPNFESERDTHMSTLSANDETLYCEKCGEHYNVQVSSSCCGSWLYIWDLDAEYRVAVEEDD